MTKPKTLGGLVDESFGEGAGNADVFLHELLHGWLHAHNITDATPLVVADMGVLEDVADHGQAVVMAFHADDGLWQHMEDCEGRTVVLLAKKKQVPGIAPEGASD